MFIEFNKEVIDSKDLVEYLKNTGIKLPEYRCAVIALILDREGNILLQRRGPKSRDEVGKLEDIGGAVEDTDLTFRDAMNREILEEVGSDINYTIDELVGASLITKYDSRSNSEVNWFFLLYKCTYIDGELKINEPGKSLGYEFYHQDELPINEVAETTLKFWEFYTMKKDV
jgi:8-oxo-dGTP pyrophosphatase MutT (NUDIX family)